MTEKIEITVDYETEATQSKYAQAVRNVTYTITHDGEMVFSETMSERMFREAHTPLLSQKTNLALNIWNFNQLKTKTTAGTPSL